MRHFTPIIVAALMATAVAGAGIYQAAQPPIDLTLTVVQR
jgi:hypothetical protein